MHYCSRNFFKHFSIFLFVLAIVLSGQATAQAATVTLAWDANDPIPEGYKVFQRTEGSSYDYQAPVWTGTDTTCQLTDLLSDTTYYYVVRAFQGTEDSGDSNEVVFLSETPVPASHTITVTAQAGGAITPAGTVTVAEGDSQIFDISPDAHQVISDVLVDGQFVGAVSSYTFNNVTADHTIAASFTPQTYTIGVSSGANGSVAPSGNIDAAYGTTPTFTITPNTGYHVADVLVDGVSVGAVSSYTFAPVAANHTLSAVFAVNTYSLTATVGANGSITPSGMLTADHGTSQTFGIAANSGYQIQEVYVDGQPVGALTSYTFSQIAADHTISASFSALQHLITAQAGQGGQITPAGSVPVHQGGAQLFAISPDTGYEIADVLVDGISVGTPASYTFDNVQAAHTIQANFALSNQAPVADAGPDQSVEETGSVLLSGMNSYDLDDGIASFQWLQVEGPSVVLSNQSDTEANFTSDAEVTFTAPETGPEGLALVFELLVTDHAGNTATDTCIVNVVWVNMPPTAQAGADQVAQEGQLVTLNGANSVDPDQDITTYYWQQTSGPVVQLSDPTAMAPTFTAPEVDAAEQGASLAFQLTVTDSGGLQDTDSTLVTVTWINAPPVADAGPDQELLEGADGVLDGSNSRDGDDGIATYQWTQTDGTPVLLSDATAVSPTFTAPNVSSQGMTLTFQLTVTDHEGLQHQDTCNVNVIWENIAPQAAAGPDQTVDESSLVQLDGSGSSDADDGIATYQWSQTGGPMVSLSDPQAVAPTFSAPDVGTEGAALSFTLTVVDGGGLRAEDSCVVNVTWQNQPPVAQAGPDGQAYAEETVPLDGSASHDSDDGIASYRWRQVSGTPVSIDDPGSPVTSFKAPTLDTTVTPSADGNEDPGTADSTSTDTELVFELSVTDFGGLQSADTCIIMVQPPVVQDDTTAPEIQVTEPSGWFIRTNASRITVRGTASDDRQVDRVEWRTSYGYRGVANGTENWEIADLPLGKRKNIITLEVYDTAGNSSSVQLKIYARFRY